MSARDDPAVTPVRYDVIGDGYSGTRREDPALGGRIVAALGGARSVVNVGAGAGSYEPADRFVVAVEPSAVMTAQRPPDRGPAVRATAGRLPLRDGCVDAAMAVLTVHHWDDELETGITELRRVARGPVVVVTYDPEVSSRMWLPSEYFPEAADLDRASFPGIGRLVDLLGGPVGVEEVLTPRDTPDWTFGSFWAHPERVLDPVARAATSGFARTDPQVVERVVAEVASDLADGSWDRRHGDLRRREHFDAGMRLVVAR